MARCPFQLQSVSMSNPRVWFLGTSVSRSGLWPEITEWPTWSPVYPWTYREPRSAATLVRSASIWVVLRDTDSGANVQHACESACGSTGARQNRFVSFSSIDAGRTHPQDLLHPRWPNSRPAPCSSYIHSGPADNGMSQLCWSSRASAHRVLACCRVDSSSYTPNKPRAGARRACCGRRHD
jgi:hypothetical protein